MHPSQPNAMQRQWREDLRALGLGRVIHHATDRTMRIKGVGNIGHWFLVPCVDQDHHKQIHFSLGHDRKPYEKTKFKEACDLFEDAGRELPFGRDVYDAIMEFRR